MESLPLSVGARLQVTIEKVVHGGHFIARVDGAVLFVRHAIPGEEVIIEITDVTKNFARAEVVEVIHPSPDRISPPCAYAGACGGCDFQHISYARQRDLKADVITEQFSRIAQEKVVVKVEECGPSLGWRTRATATADSTGKLGFYSARSHEVVAVDDCIVMHPSTHFAKRALNRFTPGEKVVIAPEKGVVGEQTLHISESSFWQGHINAPAILTEAVKEMVDFKPGDHVFDLYGGVGLFTSAIIDLIGAGGRVDLIEGNRAAAEDAAQNFARFPHIFIHHGSVEKVIQRFKSADIVLLDPPRDGAGQKVVRSMAALTPRTIAYVACDPASLARDTGYLRDSGYMLENVRAFDLFPMTHHVETIALFRAMR